MTEPVSWNVEHSDRAKYVTEQVKLWIANDSDYIEGARFILKEGGPGGLADWLLRVIKDSREFTAPWQVAQELAPNDFQRVHWDEVAEELRDLG